MGGRKINLFAPYDAFVVLPPPLTAQVPKKPGLLDFALVCERGSGADAFQAAKSSQQLTTKSFWEQPT